MDINDAWKSTCKAILGDEVGDLRHYEKYLTEYVDRIETRKSSISGKPVSIDDKHIPENARLISSDEAPQYLELMKKMKLDLNSMKDLDSIVDAVSERAYYAGSIITGNSVDVRESCRCVDSTCVYRSNDIYGAKFIAYSSSVRFCEYLFGCNWQGDDRFYICGYETMGDTRCMESMRTLGCSDCMYSANIEGCSHCMFSFNLKNRHNAIGNLELEKGRYMELRAKLLEDLRSDMERKRCAPGILDMINK
jgi:hypothetical protein